MNEHYPSTAVLLFALPSEMEARRKPLVGSGGRDERVWQTLELLTLAKIAAAGLPVVVSHRLPGGQLGTFGEQLLRAARAVLDQGYDSVICVGNDCPSLRPQDLTQAARALQRGQLPVGADQRGGVYLVGFTRSVLTHNGALALLPWQTTSLASALLAMLHEEGQPPFLLTQNHADWNTRTDVCPNDVVTGSRWMAALLAAFWGHETRFRALSPSFLQSGRPAPCGLRGPPVSG